MNFMTLTEKRFGFDSKLEAPHAAETPTSASTPAAHSEETPIWNTPFNRYIMNKFMMVN